MGGEGHEAEVMMGMEWGGGGAGYAVFGAVVRRRGGKEFRRYFHSHHIGCDAILRAVSALRAEEHRALSVAGGRSVVKPTREVVSVVNRSCGGV